MRLLDGLPCSEFPTQPIYPLSLALPLGMAKLSHSFVNCPRHRPGQLKLDTYSRNGADGKRQIKAKQIKSNKIDGTRRNRERERESATAKMRQLPQGEAISRQQQLEQEWLP